ncbi:ribosomal protection-like ABC-F family protein [Lactobacillus sp. LL6]|uniref:ribosomal protection-like ABC-F family protein n=1 Tax=Lactobacillus sp. LL6 TaxID=2596827 RepID=UPI00118490D8|nr:ABC-F type ribosomal protection protein [Lactobacillus sp. LL6]TSO26456.1 ABC-F type ribosomal protection protein [Lactobacillus sp. LL6]
MSIIKITNLSYGYENSSSKIFSDLNLNLDSNWKLGLVGRNGAGKTTFLNLLRGKLTATGQITSKNNFSYFPLHIENENELAIYELQKEINVEQWELEREMNLLDLDSSHLWQPYNTLSGGEKTKLLLAASFADYNNFPLIDEPTNHLDENSRLEIAQYLKNSKSGYIVVSHDRDFLNQVTDHILAIENTEIHLYQGNYASYEDTKEKRDAFNQNKNIKLQKEISDLTKSAQRIKGYSEKSEKQKSAANHKNEINVNIDRGFVSHKAAKIMKKSKNIERRINKNIDSKMGLLQNIEQAPKLTMNFLPDYHHELINLQKFGIKFDDGTNLFDNLNLSISNKEILALQGKNGSGKTTLVNYLLSKNQQIQTSGKVVIQSGLKISYLPQNFTEYHGNLKDFAHKQKISYEELLNNLRKMGFKRETFNVAIEEMSMGQQKRVAIAKSLAEEANLYIWDEPANYLDIYNQNQLIELLKTIKPAMLLIEHDKHFIDQVADEKISL